MTQTGIQLFQMLKPKLGERESEALINFVDLKSKENKQEIEETNLKILATKADLWGVKDDLRGGISGLRTGLKEDIGNLRTELKGDMSNLRNELKGDISNLKTELKGDISNLRTEFKEDIARLDVKIGDVKSDVIRWVFAIFVAIILSFIGLYLKH